MERNELEGKGKSRSFVPQDDRQKSFCHPERSEGSALKARNMALLQKREKSVKPLFKRLNRLLVKIYCNFPMSFCGKKLDSLLGVYGWIYGCKTK